MKTTRCDCGQEIAFGVIEGTDKKVPVESRTPIYRIVGEGADGTPTLRRMHLPSPEPDFKVETDNLVVNHFRTCPKAWLFTKR